MLRLLVFYVSLFLFVPIEDNDYFEYFKSLSFIYSLFLRIESKHTKRYRNYEQPYEFAYEHTLLTTTQIKIQNIHNTLIDFLMP